MALSATQLKELEKPLDAKRVLQRTHAGVQLSYIEGHWAIREANRIFGFDAWDRETVDIRLVSERESKIGAKQKDGWRATYIAKVRIKVNGIIREGCGTGHGIDVDLGQAHESALKEAETDAMKRALMTFGDPFGLALYDKNREHVVDAEAEQRAEAAKAEARKRAEKWADQLISHLRGKTFDQGVEIIRGKRAAWDKLCADHPDLAEKVNSVAEQLPEEDEEQATKDVIDNLRAGEPPFGRVNGPANGEARDGA